MRPLPVAFLAVSLLSCGSSHLTASATVNGTANGVAIEPKDAVYFSESFTSGNFTHFASAVLLSTSTGVCSDLAKNITRANQSYVVMVTDSVASDANIKAPQQTGAYTAGNVPPTTVAPTSNDTVANAAELYVYNLNADCNSTVDIRTLTSTSGTVNLVGATPGVDGVGTFDVTLDSNDHLTGSFTATYCKALGVALNLTPLAGDTNDVITANPSCQ